MGVGEVFRGCFDGVLKKGGGVGCFFCLEREKGKEKREKRNMFEKLGW